MHIVVPARHAGTGQRGVDEGTDLLGGIVEDPGLELDQSRLTRICAGAGLFESCVM